MFAGSDRESGFTKDLSGARVLFNFSSLVGSARLVHRGGKCSPRGKMFFGDPMLLKMCPGFGHQFEQRFVGQAGNLGRVITAGYLNQFGMEVIDLWRVVADFLWRSDLLGSRHIISVVIQ